MEEEYTKLRKQCEMLVNGSINEDVYFTYCVIRLPETSGYIYNRYIYLEKLTEDDISLLRKEEAIFLLSYMNQAITQIIKNTNWYKEVYKIANS